MKSIALLATVISIAIRSTAPANAAPPPILYDVEADWQQAQDLPDQSFAQGASVSLRYRLKSRGRWLDLSGLTARWEGRSSGTSTQALTAASTSTVTNTTPNYFHIDLDSGETGTAVTNWAYSFIVVFGGNDYVLGEGTLDIPASAWTGAAAILSTVTAQGYTDAAIVTHAALTNVHGLAELAFENWPTGAGVEYVAKDGAWSVATAASGISAATATNIALAAVAPYTNQVTSASIAAAGGLTNAAAFDAAGSAAAVSNALAAGAAAGATAVQPGTVPSFDDLDHQLLKNNNWNDSGHTNATLDSVACFDGSGNAATRAIGEFVLAIDGTYTQTVALAAGAVPQSRTITVNGVTGGLSSNVSFTVEGGGDFMADGSVPMTGTLDMGNTNITSVLKIGSNPADAWEIDLELKRLNDNAQPGGTSNFSVDWYEGILRDFNTQSNSLNWISRMLLGDWTCDGTITAAEFIGGGGGLTGIATGFTNMTITGSGVVTGGTFTATSITLDRTTLTASDVGAIATNAAAWQYDSLNGPRQDLGSGIAITWEPTKYAAKWAPTNAATFSMSEAATYPRGDYKLWVSTTNAITWGGGIQRIGATFTAGGTNLWIIGVGDTTTNWIVAGRAF